MTVTRILAVPDPSGRAVTCAREAASRFEAQLDALALDPDEADPAGAVVREAAHRACDLIVLSDAGMRDRTEFLLANVANRVSHAARCSVVFVSDVDMELRPVELIGSFIARTLTRDLARHGDPRVALYELQKLRVRSRRLFEGLERITGARPGPRLQSRGAGPRWSSSAPCNA